MNKMSAENNMPAIRFKGFRGDWEEKYLGEIGTLKNGMNFDKAALGHGHPFVNLQDVFGKNEVSNINLGLAFSTVNQRKEYSLIKGDVLFIRSSVKPEGVGEAAVISKSLENTTYSGFIIRFRPNIAMDVNFNRFVYSTANSRRQILASSTSSANSNINQDSLQRIKLTLPCNKEQTKIGNYFQQLDTLITLHQTKHGKLLSLKKALLEKMFPRYGAAEPEIRFKGFSGEWKETALGDISEVSTGYPFDSNNFKSKGEYLVITNGNIQDNLSFVDTSQGNRIDLDKNIKLYDYVLDEDDVLVTMDGTVGRVAKVSEGKQVLAQRVGRLKARLNSEFLYQLLSSGDFFKKMSVIAHGGTIKHISLSEIEGYQSNFPISTLEEQKIGNLFKQLDTLIYLHQTQLKKLGNIKQAFLEKMFV